MGGLVPESLAQIWQLVRHLGDTSLPTLAGVYGRAAVNDFLSAVAAMAAVLVFDTLPGLVIGVVLSLTLLLYRASRPNVATLGRLGRAWVDLARHPEARTKPGVVVVRVERGCSSPTPSTSGPGCAH